MKLATRGAQRFEPSPRAVELQPSGPFVLAARPADAGESGYGGTGKLYFGAMKVKNIRIHNRPAYNSEVHATRDMGVGELNNCYEDAELADTVVAVGTNALETQTNYFLNHWVPNLRGATLNKKKALMPNEPHAAARMIIIDPRRTVTVNACEVEAGKDNVLHLAINSGADLVLFNALFTYIADKGWAQKDFIEKSTFRSVPTRPPLYPARGDSPAMPGHLTSFEAALEGCRTSKAHESWAVLPRREPGEIARIRLAERGRVGVPLGGPDPEARQSLGETDGAGDSVEHGDAGLALEIAREVGHAGAAEHDRFGAVFGERAQHLGLDRAAGRRALLFERQHRHVGGPNPSAAGCEPVLGEVVFDRRNRAGECGDDAESLRDEARQMERRLADADDRRG